MERLCVCLCACAEEEECRKIIQDTLLSSTGRDERTARTQTDRSIF